MATKTVQAIRVAVTRGDCFPDNRPDGSSNTGTYFVCSMKDWKVFEPYFLDGVKYYFSTTKIKIYVDTLAIIAAKYKDVYPDKFASVKTYGKVFEDAAENPYCEIGIRKNDVRAFMRFKDNSDVLVNAFRHLLYSDLSLITMEMTPNGIAIYPEIDLEGPGPKSSSKKLSFEDLICDD